MPTFPPPHLIIAHKDRDDEVRNKNLVAIDMKHHKKERRDIREPKEVVKTLNEAGIRDCCMHKGCDAAVGVY